MIMKKELTKEEMEKIIGFGILISAFATGSIIGAFVYSFFKKI